MGTERGDEQEVELILKGTRQVQDSGLKVGSTNISTY